MVETPPQSVIFIFFSRPLVFNPLLHKRFFFKTPVKRIKTRGNPLFFTKGRLISPGERQKIGPPNKNFGEQNKGPTFFPPFVKKAPNPYPQNKICSPFFGKVPPKPFHLPPTKKGNFFVFLFFLVCKALFNTLLKNQIFFLGV